MWHKSFLGRFTSLAVFLSLSLSLLLSVLPSRPQHHILQLLINQYQVLAELQGKSDSTLGYSTAAVELLCTQLQPAADWQRRAEDCE